MTSDQTRTKKDATGDGREGVGGPRGPSLLIWLPVTVFVALAVVFGLSLKSGDPSRLPSALIGKLAPAVDFAPLKGIQTDGKPVPGITSASLRLGEVTVVNFWASWCVPCIQEHPLLVELGQKTGVRIFGVNYKDPPPGGLRFLGRYGNPYAAVGTDPTGRGAIEWGVYGMPETFILAGDGRIVYKHVGPISRKSLESNIIPEIEKLRATAGF